jgi:anaerobic glycerol-3-phosphate dehydrogenase
MNLHLAGALLADHDPAGDGSGLGTALITGWRAGELATEA